MNKTLAVGLFGSATKTAKAIGISQQAVSKWPAVLTRHISDRVVAALVRANRIEEACDVIYLEGEQ